MRTGTCGLTLGVHVCLRNGNHQLSLNYFPKILLLYITVIYMLSLFIYIINYIIYILYYPIIFQKLNSQLWLW